MQKDNTIPDSKTEAMLAKVEEMGVFFERTGLSPMTGRVMAYLLMCEPPHKDFFEIQDFLKASKSAVSNALNNLNKQETVDYVTFSGDRRRYFRINPQGWLSHLKRQVRRAMQMRLLLQGVLAERAGSKYPAFTDELERILDFHVTFAENLEEGIRQWEEKHS